MTRKNPPILMAGGLTDRVFIATRYTDKGDGTFVVHEKWDVTDEFDLIAKERSERG